MVLIKVKTLSHKIYDINVDENALISIVKEKISDVHESKLNDHEYKLIHLGKVLNDNDIINNSHEGKLFILMTTKKKTEEIKKPTTPPLPVPVQLPQIQPIAQIPALPSLSSLPPIPHFPVIQPQMNLGNLANLGLSNQEQDLLNILINPQMNQASGNDAINNLVNQLNNLLINPSFQYPEEGEDDEDHVEEVDGNAPENDNADNHDNGEHNEAAQVPQTNQQFNVEMVGNFTNKEIDEINELVNMGYDYFEVIQI